MLRNSRPRQLYRTWGNLGLVECAATAARQTSPTRGRAAVSATATATADAFRWDSTTYGARVFWSFATQLQRRPKIRNARSHFESKKREDGRVSPLAETVEAEAKQDDYMVEEKKVDLDSVEKKEEESEEDDDNLQEFLWKAFNKKEGAVREEPQTSPGVVSLVLEQWMEEQRQGRSRSKAKPSSFQEKEEEVTVQAQTIEEAFTIQEAVTIEEMQIIEQCYRSRRRRHWICIREAKTFALVRRSGFMTWFFPFPAHAFQASGLEKIIFRKHWEVLCGCVLDLVSAVRVALRVLESTMRGLLESPLQSAFEMRGLVQSLLSTSQGIPWGFTWESMRGLRETISTNLDYIDHHCKGNSYDQDTLRV